MSTMLTTYLHDGELTIRFESLVALVNERPATAQDFACTVGAFQWALMPGFERDELTGSTERICQIEIRRILDKNTVEILADVNTSGMCWALARFDADELALRIEAS